VNLHQGTESKFDSKSGWDNDNPNVAEESQCGFINIDSVQQVVAAKWAIDVINNQSLPNELKIGRKLFHFSFFSLDIEKYSDCTFKIGPFKSFSASCCTGKKPTVLSTLYRVRRVSKRVAIFLRV
jgi:hypothetical protein